MKIASLAFVNVCVLFSGFVCSNVKAVENKPVKSDLNFLKVAKDRQNTINQLLRIVNSNATKDQWNTEENDAYSMAIEVLGAYRVQEATNVLTRNISFQSTRASYDFNALSDFPSVFALIKIGNPSLESIQRRLSPLGHLVDPQPLNPRDLHLFAYVVRKIDGEEVGLFRLQLWLKNAKTEKQKKNFSDLVEIYQKKEDEFAIKRALASEEDKIAPAVRAPGEPQLATPAPLAPAPK